MKNTNDTNATHELDAYDPSYQSRHVARVVLPTAHRCTDDVDTAKALYRVDCQTRNVVPT